MPAGPCGVVARELVRSFSPVTPEHAGVPRWRRLSGVVLDYETAGDNHGNRSYTHTAHAHTHTYTHNLAWVAYGRFVSFSNTHNHNHAQAAADVYRRWSVSCVKAAEGFIRVKGEPEVASLLDCSSIRAAQVLMNVRVTSLCAMVHSCVLAHAYHVSYALSVNANFVTALKLYTCMFLFMCPAEIQPLSEAVPPRPAS